MFIRKNRTPSFLTHPYLRRPFSRNPSSSPLLLAPEDPEAGGGGGGGADPSGGGDPGDDDKGGDGDEPQVFDQKRVDSMLAKQRRELTTKLEQKYSSQMSEVQAELDRLKTEAEERERERELEGADGKQKELIAERQQREKLERDHKKLQEQIASLQQSDAEKAAALQQRAIEDALLPALVKAGVASSEKARRQALRLMSAEGEPQFDPDSNELIITVGGKQFTDLEAAAAEFLQDNDHFAKAPPSGPSPTGRPNGRTPAKDRESMSNSQLISSGLKERLSRR